MVKKYRYFIRNRKTGKLLKRVFSAAEVKIGRPKIWAIQKTMVFNLVAKDRATGCLASNGDDLFENDIVDFESRRGVLILKDGRFLLSCLNGKDNLDIWLVPQSHRTIIGNTHENLEMIVE